MTYTVKEIFCTLQGEGGQMGRVAVFCRFAGCNLWSGREEDRATAACTFCDTDFLTGKGKYPTAVHLADQILDVWDRGAANRFVVLTGGEPLLQVDDDLILRLHERNFEIALETNGTIRAPSARIDWICVSPKSINIKQTGGDELKLVFPQAGIDPTAFEHMAFNRFSLSPMAGPKLQANTDAALAYCLAHPRWRLTHQAHKIWNIR